MNEHSLNDPLLQSLEARLASNVPAVSASEQQRMLYQCAFAAGRQSGVRTMRCWQAATATLAALMIAVSLPQFLVRNQVAVQVRVPPAPTIVTNSSQPAPPPASPASDRAAGIQLDAWQIPNAGDIQHSQMLAQHDAATPSASSLRSLTRQFLE